MKTRFVLDASVVMAWCFEDESNEYADAVLESFAWAEAIVPSIWPLEIGNVLVVAERRNRLSRQGSSTFLDLIQRLPISIEPQTQRALFEEIVSLARKHTLSTYDASYLHLAMWAAAPLATLDASLATAARQCAVPLFDPRTV